MKRRTLLQAVMVALAIVAGSVRGVAATSQPLGRKSNMKIHAVTIDTANPRKLAAWWAEALGIPVGNDYGQIVQLAESPAFPLFQFQKIEDVPTQTNRVHVDLRTPDLDGESERLVKLGATVIQKIELQQIRYTTLTDPDGNKFDLVAE